MFASVLLMMAQAAPSTAAAMPTVVTPDDNKIVCQRTLEVGSRIPIRVCRTKAQWARLARDTEENIRTAHGFNNVRSGTIIGPVNDSRSLLAGPRDAIVSPGR